jgi:hypothetical protein
MTLAADFARILLATAGLLLPGTGWMLAGRWPLPWLAGGILSALAILAGVLGLVAAGVPVTFGSLGLWLVLVGAPGWMQWWRKRSPHSAAAASHREWWLLLPVLPAALVAVWHACLQPLSGADVGFRWNLLAELLVETGGLGSYPPATADGFAQYFWADGINPLVSSLYAWVYLAGGSLAKGWTAIPVLLQFTGIMALLHGLGREWGGARGGLFACALGGATMLLQFLLNLGQETGLTTLGAGSMVFYLCRWRETREAGLVVPAALGAALVACAREYGPVVAVVGTGWILAARGPWRFAAGFAALAALLPLAWQVRVWTITGNPVYAHAVAGFPSNPVFDAWMQGYRAIYGEQLRHVATWREIARIGLVTALPAVLGLGAGAALWRKQSGWSLVLLIAGLFVGLWYVSVPYTAGGLFYSMRVLGPTLLLGCAWGGASLAHAVPGRRHLAGVLVGLMLFACDASLRAWTIPQNPYTLPPQEWSRAGYQLQDDFERENTPFLRQVARAVPGRVLSDAAGLREFFRREGKTYSPFWSPDIAWLFSGQVQPGAAARLRALGFSHLLIKRSSITIDFLGRTGALPSLEGHLHVVMANSTFLLLELRP